MNEYLVKIILLLFVISFSMGEFYDNIPSVE